MKADPSHPHTLTSPTSSNQSLPKSVSTSTRREFQNFPYALKKKLKHADTQTTQTELKRQV